jgi:hypothetical protein
VDVEFVNHGIDLRQWRNPYRDVARLDHQR